LTRCIFSVKLGLNRINRNRSTDDLIGGTDWQRP